MHLLNASPGYIYSHTQRHTTKDWKVSVGLRTLSQFQVPRHLCLQIEQPVNVYTAGCHVRESHRGRVWLEFPRGDRDQGRAGQ